MKFITGRRYLAAMSIFAAVIGIFFSNLYAEPTENAIVQTPKANQELIRWWPRITPAAMPTKLCQLAVLEFLPELGGGDSAVTVEIILPENIQYLGCPTAWINPDRPNVHAIPFPERTAYAAEVQQNDRTLTMSFPAGSFGKSPQTFIPLLLDVNTQPGLTDVNVLFKSGNLAYSEDIKLEIFAPLNPQPCKKPLVLWDYPGIDEAFLPIFINGFVSAGFNRFYVAREELPNRKSATDFQTQFNTTHGIAFSLDAVSQYFRTRPLPSGLPDIPAEKPDCGWMIDHPEASRLLIKEFLQYMTDGKNFQYVILDCERGAFNKNGTILVNDLSLYNRTRFANLYQITPVPEPEEITADFRPQWIEYCCTVSADYAKMLNAILHEFMPNCEYEIYSGYQYADHETKQTYAVDWQLMPPTGMTVGVAGYFGSRENIEATAEAIAPTPFIPAEMYMENFNTPSVPMPRLTVNQFAYRLIQSYLWGGCNGMQIWHSGVLTGAGLLSINIFKDFVNNTADLTDGATRINALEVLNITPRQAAIHVYAFQKDKKNFAIILNPAATNSVIRFTPKKSAKKWQVIKLEPFSYAIINIE